MQKFAPRFARAPDNDLRAPLAFASCALRRSAARTCEVTRSKLSLGPIEIGRHRRNEVGAILASYAWQSLIPAILAMA
jgi:hypothetical protein